MISATKNGVKISIYVQPGAKKSEFVGVHGQSIKIRIKAPPADGKANETLIEFLADFFKISLQKINIVQGQQSRYKVIEIYDIDISKVKDFFKM